MTIVEFNPQKLNNASQSHFLSGKDEGGFWKIELKEGLNQLSDVNLIRLKKHPDIESYENLQAIKFHDSPKSRRSRLSELHDLFGQRGYLPLVRIAEQLGLPTEQPSGGWESLIPLIVDAEVETGIIQEDISEPKRRKRPSTSSTKKEEETPS